MPKLLNFRLPAGLYFLNCDIIELKRSSKLIFFLFPYGIVGRKWVKYEDETGDERNFVVSKDKPINNYINEKVSPRAVEWHVYWWGYLKRIAEIDFPCFTFIPKAGMVLKGLVFTLHIHKYRNIEFKNTAFLPHTFKPVDSWQISLLTRLRSSMFLSYSLRVSQRDVF